MSACPSGRSCAVSAPFDVPEFRAVVLGQLGESRLDVAIEADLAGPMAHARSLDVDAKGARRDIHRRVGTAILFESSGGQVDKVAHRPELRFAVGEPDVDTTTIDNAATALEGSGFFMRKVGTDGYRIHHQATLKKVVSDRRASLDEETEIKPALRKLVETERHGLKVIDLGAGHASAGETLCGRIISVLKAEARLNESVGAGYLDRNWPPALKEAGEWPLERCRRDRAGRRQLPHPAKGKAGPPTRRAGRDESLGAVRPESERRRLPVAGACSRGVAQLAYLLIRATEGDGGGGVSGESAVGQRRYMPQTVTGAPSPDGGRRKIFSAQGRSGARSNRMRCPASAPQRSM